jgi:hypothetical protein
MTGGRPASAAPPPSAPPASPQVRGLVAAALAGERYRRRQAGSLAQDLRTVSHDELARALAAAHAAPLFLHHFGPLLPNGALRDELRAWTRSQRLYASQLRHHFVRVRRALEGLSAPPVVLKGAALWGLAYAAPALRKTRDMDLLVASERDLRRAAAVLQALGFSGDGEAMRRALETPDHYELPPLVSPAPVPVDAEDARALALLRARRPALADFHSAAGGGEEMTVEVELHRALFLYRDGTMLAPAPELVTPHPLLPGCARLTLPAQVVYLATKFGLDTEGAEGAPPQPQSLKLLGDVVRLVERATPAELEAALELAEEWRCARFVARTLATAAPLLPEVAFTGAPLPPYDLDALVDRAAGSEGGG